MVFFATRGLLGPSGTMLSDIEEGELVKLNENGSPVDFYVAKHDYESDLNGSGRTLVVRKDLYRNMSWNSSDVNSWSDCTARSWLNGDYKNMLDSNIQDVIGTTTYKYSHGNLNLTISNISDSVFILSSKELGNNGKNANAEGTELSISSALRIAYLGGSVGDQWTRSPYTGTVGMVWGVNTSGDHFNQNASSSYGIRPVFTLPSIILADNTGLIV